MKNPFKKFQNSTKGNRVNDESSNEDRPFSLSGWFNSAKKRNQNIRESSLDSNREENLEPFDSSDLKGQNLDEECQLKLALELSAKEDPEAAEIEAVKQISLGSYPLENLPAGAVAYQYWNYNALSYDDKILDGFYDLYGVSTSSKLPSLLDLQQAQPSDNSTWEAILVDRANDANLLKIEQKALEMFVKPKSKNVNFAGNYLLRNLAFLVADYMGGPVEDPEYLSRAWKSLAYSLRGTIGSMVLPLGSLTIGLVRHRALLFKVLADSVGIPCRLVKGQQYTGSDDAAMNFVKLDNGREYIIDLMADPGALIPSDAVESNTEYEEPFLSVSPLSRYVDPSHVASSSSGVASSFDESSEPGTAERKYKSKNLISASNEADGSRETRGIEKNLMQETPSGTHLPLIHGRSPSWTEGLNSPAVHKMNVDDVSQYMINAAKENPQLAQKLHDVLLESGVVAPPNLFDECYTENSDVSVVDPNFPTEFEGRNKMNDIAQQTKGNVPSHVEHLLAATAAVVASSVVAAVAKTRGDSNLELPMAAAAAAAVVATTAAVAKQLENFEAHATSPSDHEALGSGDRRYDSFGSNHGGEKRSDRSTGNDSTQSDVMLDDVADCEIPWEELTLGERIGLGSYGEVYRGDWHGTEVAVKKFLDQAVTVDSLELFKSEVQIMKRVRHPNVVLFMGAVTRAPNLSIVTEFLPRGCLYRLIHRPNNQLDERRRLRMAFDTARGMNYLHNCSPVIVHRDLKSPNLLVDKNFVVKVCDFGLSRMKQSTFLSSRSTAGTAEWMAPEVLRNEPSDEKCDVYSFGVILWELCTMQQPWRGLNPMQVIGAVGFQHRHLEIPDDLDPIIADIITKCWQKDPKLRPSFGDIMAALKPLLKSVTTAQLPRSSGLVSTSQVATDRASKGQ